MVKQSMLSRYNFGPDEWAKVPVGAILTQDYDSRCKWQKLSPSRFQNLNTGEISTYIPNGSWTVNGIIAWEVADEDTVSSDLVYEKAKAAAKANGCPSAVAMALVGLGISKSVTYDVGSTFTLHEFNALPVGTVFRRQDSNHDRYKITDKEYVMFGEETKLSFETLQGVLPRVYVIKYLPNGSFTIGEDKQILKSDVIAAAQTLASDLNWCGQYWDVLKEMGIDKPKVMWKVGDRFHKESTGFNEIPVGTTFVGETDCVVRFKITDTKYAFAASSEIFNINFLGGNFTIKFIPEQ